ncbi:MAG TPA: MobF family relaxase [Dermatophilaceae bacterium]|nr:MobF family relaxase [Dermatophilaceae bacterium]
MTLHVLHAGDGYTYLTRQVASGDHERRRGDALADYYTADGNPPGRWVGTGRAVMGVDGQVSEAQMWALFGRGVHPDAERLVEQAMSRGATVEQATASVRLGRAFPRFDQSHRVWQERVTSAYAQFEQANGRPAEHGPERDLVRWNVAVQLFTETHGRPPVRDGEVKAFVAAVARAPRQAVAGVDLVFTPVKSVSVLWALGDDRVRREVEAAHEAAWRRAFSYVEEHAARTRTGAGGVAQIDTRGLVAAAFDHPDSRTGDPNLHTHVAVSAKVQGVDGKWRALDLRVLHALAVSASETYNTAVEDELRTRLGVRFVERPGGRSKRPVREVAGIPGEVLRAFSSRRFEIENGYETALAEYRAAHGHDPPRHVQYRLAQEATLANRPTKAGPRSWAAARHEWHARAAQVLATLSNGSGDAVDAMLAAVLAAGRGEAAADEPSVHELCADQPRVDGPPTAKPDVGALAVQAVANVAEVRSTWTRWHIHAEAHRLTRGHPMTPDARDALVAAVTDAALDGHSLAIRAPDLNPQPAQLRRADGESVYTVHGGTRYTSEPLILAVEDQLLEATTRHTGSATPAATLSQARARLQVSRGWCFDDAQVDLAASFVCDDRALVVGVGPAGTGKTTAMQLAAAALAADGRRLVALAPSARAAAVLGAEVGVPATTIAKFLHAQDTPDDTPTRMPGPLRLAAGDVVLVDEAGMAGTPALGRILAVAGSCGALVRLLGDPMQLTAVEAGGALRLLAQAGAGVELDHVHRFTDPAEAAATLRLRRGWPSAIGFYQNNNRLADGARDAMLDAVYDGWNTDLGLGRSTLMVSASTAEVAKLSGRARRDRVAAGVVEPSGVELHDGNSAGVGDLVVTRDNRRTLLVCGGRDFVKNGDLWAVTARHPGGDLTVRHVGHGGAVLLPAGYVAEHVELGYATTIHRAQGMTVDTAHLLVDNTMTRESLYVGMSRGRTRNRAYVVTEEALEVDLHRPPGPALDALDVLTGVLARESSEHSATETIHDTLAAAESLASLVPAYLDGHARAVITDDLVDGVRAGLRDAGGPALEDRVATAPAWRRLLLACASGDDPRGTVAEAVRSRLLDTTDAAGDPAAVLAWRVPRLADADTGRTGIDLTDLDRTRSCPLWPPWLPAVTATTDDSDVRRWVGRQDQLIQDRVAALVDLVDTDRPAWAAGIPPPSRDDPTDAGGAAGGRWRRDVGTIAAYRDQFRVTEPTHPLGPAHGDAEQRHARLAAQAAWDRLRGDDRCDRDGLPLPVNDRLRALAERHGSVQPDRRHPHTAQANRDPAGAADTNDVRGDVRVGVTAGEALRRLTAAREADRAGIQAGARRATGAERGPRL